MTGHPPPCGRHPCSPLEPPFVAILLSMLVTVVCGCPVTFSCPVQLPPIHTGPSLAGQSLSWASCAPLPALDHISVFPGRAHGLSLCPKVPGQHRPVSLYKTSSSSRTGNEGFCRHCNLLIFYKVTVSLVCTWQIFFLRDLYVYKFCSP